MSTLKAAATGGAGADADAGTGTDATDKVDRKGAWETAGAQSAAPGGLAAFKESE